MTIPLIRTLDKKKVDDLLGPRPKSILLELREHYGFSLGELSIQSGITRSVLHRAEDGCYIEPLPRLLDFWVSFTARKPKNPYHEVSELDIVQGMEDYKAAMYKRHRRYFGALVVDPSNDADHPLRQLRKNRTLHEYGIKAPVGISEVSRDLCLPAATLDYWEKKWTRQVSIPKAFINTLHHIGYTDHDITMFEHMHDQWRENNLKARVIFE